MIIFTAKQRLDQGQCVGVHTSPRVLRVVGNTLDLTGLVYGKQCQVVVSLDVLSWQMLGMPLVVAAF